MSEPTEDTREPMEEDEITGSGRLERELSSLASSDARAQLAQRIGRMAATAAPRRDLLAEARLRARDAAGRGLLGAAARRTALVAAAVTLFGGATVVMAAHDADPGTAFYPLRAVGHAVAAVFTGDDLDEAAGSWPEPSTGPTQDQPVDGSDDSGDGSTGPSDDNPGDGDGDGPGKRRGHHKADESEADHDNGPGNDDRDRPGKRRGHHKADESEADHDNGRGNDDRDSGDKAERRGRGSKGKGKGHGHGRGNGGGNGDEGDDSGSRRNRGRGHGHGKGAARG
jgi:hypothetical protein